MPAAVLIQPLVDFEREQAQRREIRAALGFAQHLDRGVRLARVRRPDEILERAGFAA